ncbi:Nif3-like dinuclear metal center hexameric protein [Rathayibacter soli]|uniref:Nif3-like dinuclear metal center hexameric protein n=1 Tax=Rathayibacter soli TaxID=3144168 RepID=UPI0027E49939|nr:Nif3-like dinuclear metal center hexameric protein [Glaciibacter superstes]
MSETVASVRAVTEHLWPSSGTEAWDAPGLLSGALDAPVASIHLAVDAVADTVAEAIDGAADLLLVHHPLLLRGVTSVAEDRYKGALLARLIRADCALIAAHTNADVVAHGTSAVFADLLGLTNTRPIASAGAANGETGIGRIGALTEATTLGRLAQRIAELLPATASGVRAAGEFERPVRVVALCAGAGDAYLADPAVRAADVYITSDLRHHPASEAREQALIGDGPALIDVSHWASEWLWLQTAADQLRSALPNATITVSELRTDPWDFAIVQ